MNTQDLKGLMQRLTALYYAQAEQMNEAGGNPEYTQALSAARRDIAESFPGMTIVFAEVQERDYITGPYQTAMTHVLAPAPDTLDSKMPIPQRIKDAVEKEARRYFDRDPESAQVQITAVEVADTWSNPYEWDTRVKWVDPTDDQEHNPKDDLLYTVTVNEQGEVVDIVGPEF